MCGTPYLSHKISVCYLLDELHPQTNNTNNNIRLRYFVFIIISFTPYIDICRCLSNKIALTAADTFIEFIFPCIGIVAI